MGNAHPTDRIYRRLVPPPERRGADRAGEEEPPLPKLPRRGVELPDEFEAGRCRLLPPTPDPVGRELLVPEAGRLTLLGFDRT